MRTKLAFDDKHGPLDCMSCLPHIRRLTSGHYDSLSLQRDLISVWSLTIMLYACLREHLKASHFREINALCSLRHSYWPKLVLLGELCNSRPINRMVIIRDCSRWGCSCRNNFQIDVLRNFFNFLLLVQRMGYYLPKYYLTKKKKDAITWLSSENNKHLKLQRKYAHTSSYLLYSQSIFCTNNSKLIRYMILFALFKYTIFIRQLLKTATMS